MRIKFIVLLLISALLPAVPAAAQNENAIWMLATRTGLNFSGGTPVLVDTSALVADEGVATVCDAEGNLLFYSNGGVIWNRNHEIMTGGTLFGCGSTAQAVRFLKIPGSADRYYVFSNCGFANRSAYVSVVDMGLNNGLGDVVPNSEQLIGTGLSEAALLVPHADCGKYWLLFRLFGTSLLHAYLADSSGVSANPVISLIPSLENQWNSNPSTFTISPDFTRLVYTEQDTNDLHILRFDQATGIASEWISFRQTAFNYGLCYGTCFSASGNKLYASIWDIDSIINGWAIWSDVIYQIDLSSGDSLTIVQSLTAVDSIRIDSVIDPNRPGFRGQMRRGPDDKIYMVSYLSHWLTVVENPEVTGAGCTVQSQGFSVFPQLLDLGMPPEIYTDPAPPPAQSLGPDLTVCDSAIVLSLNPAYGPYAWSDGSTGDSLAVTQPGQYIANYTGCYAGPVDTITVIFAAAPLRIPDVFTPNDDAVNDVFTISGGCVDGGYLLRVYDRWGQLLFETTDAAQGWDGKTGGMPCVAGVYFYTLEYLDLSGQLQRSSGFFHLFH